jgi:putative AlgH/UPF0301 family transcriptional regulator
MDPLEEVLVLSGGRVARSGAGAPLLLLFLAANLCALLAQAAWRPDLLRELVLGEAVRAAPPPRDALGAALATGASSRASADSAARQAAARAAAGESLEWRAEPAREEDEEEEEEEEEAPAYQEGERRGVWTRDESEWSDALDAALATRFAADVGSVAGLGPGTLLRPTAAQPATSSFAGGAMLLVTQHGRSGTKGFVLNQALPEDEAARARLALREAAGEGDEGNEGDEGDLARRQRVAGAIRGSSRLWLGVGGPVRGSEEMWTHVHNCPQLHGATPLAAGLAFGGDVLEVLQDERCRVKLLYGSAQWAAGQLDSEVMRGLWHVLDPAAAHDDPLAW